MFKLGTGMEYNEPALPTLAVMMSKVKGSRNKVKVASSVWCIFAHDSITTSRRNTKIGRMVVVATGDIPHHFQGQKVKVIRPLNAVTENQLYVRKGKAYCSNFKLGIRKEYDDPHHRLAR